MHDYDSSNFVCAKCFSDDGLQKFVQAHAESNECDFCSAVGEDLIAAPLYEVTEHIYACVGRYYDDPANAGLPYETREGGWQGETYTTQEVFAEVGLDFPNTNGDQLSDAIEAISDIDLWSNAEGVQLSVAQQLKLSWDMFCHVIKHERRYFFLRIIRDEDLDDELYIPSEILKWIFSYAEQVGAFIAIPTGTRFFRARFERNGENFQTAATLGPPPAKCANQTNRMSPPGIVMTYVADNQNTALAETANRSGMFSVGEFVTQRDALILDFTKLPEVPSLFAEIPDDAVPNLFAQRPDTVEYDPRPPLEFLHNVRRDISRSIARDDRVHVEYIPTPGCYRVCSDKCHNRRSLRRWYSI